MLHDIRNNTSVNFVAVISAKSVLRAGRGGWVTRADPSPVMTLLLAASIPGKRAHPAYFYNHANASHKRW
jgi:hypothetical protein